MIKTLLGVVMFGLAFCANAQDVTRPAIHFTPQKGWMNDPNGMVFYKGEYHLFFQHTPFSTIPDFTRMHWGHAVSKDLVHWTELESALKPDDLGAIFSGSAVFDVNNTSGFGKDGIAPLVAIFTHHNSVGEKAGVDNFQNQSIAYSLDNGRTWTKYEGNPVVKNPGIRDFRDPKVFWYEEGKKWIMTLATLDHITFYSSPNLKDWKEESKFGKNAGAHGGVWECPDLISFDKKGKKVWVLIVNLNPGGPNGGSGTQYFTGGFDGSVFTADHTETKWLDFGPDEYAGVTWDNTGNRKLLIGWMNNWKYAFTVPATTWRGTMTVPRELQLKKLENDYRLSCAPAVEVINHFKNKGKWKKVNKVNTSSEPIATNTGAFQVELKLSAASSFEIKLFNKKGEEILAGFDKTSNTFYIDRAKSGRTAYLNEFAKRYTAPRFALGNAVDVTLIIDNTSIEMFADGGLTAMTSVCFPTEPFNQVAVSQNGRITNSSQWRVNNAD
ncbi:MAG: glycoside hydrolase family 32 protein [Flavipsychrobacter sp.]|nr:glycoside hydrolase family 32 protein [Flavipsychrobacter sp.]